MAPDSTENKPTPISPKKDPAKAASSRKLPFSAIVSDLGLLFVEVILPVVLSAAAIWFLFRSYNLWQMDRTLALAIFVIALVIISFMLILLLDTFTYPVRKPYRDQGVKFGSNARTRLVKLALGGIIIPIAVYVAASVVPVPSGGTAMEYLIRISQIEAQATPPEQIASLVIQSTNVNNKVLGIEALAGFHSPESLAQLIRILNEGGASLQDVSVYTSLSKAIASYGITAKTSLLDAFNKVEPTLRGKSVSMEDELYTRYFARSFDSLRSEVKIQNQVAGSQESQLAQVDAAEAQLKKSLADVQANTLKTSGDLRLGFVMQTLLAMDITQDADLLTFAQTIAADNTYPSGVRGDAILLIAKLGTKDLESSLYPYMLSTDELLQARSLQAITTLQTKPAK
jgi:hypothetical protein